MENLSRKVGYLKGLMEGLDIDQTDSTGKLLAGIVDLLGELTDRVESIDDALDDLNDYVESIDDDLSDLEDEHEDDLDFMNGEDEDEDFDDAFGDGEDKLHLLRPGEDGEGEDEPKALAARMCPECGKLFFTALEDGEDAEYLCPHCGKRVRPVLLTPENAPIAEPLPGE